MRENRDFVVPVNILTTFAHAPFSWAARHTTVCLDISVHCVIAEVKRKGGKVKAQMIDTHQYRTKHTPFIIISVVV